MYQNLIIKPIITEKSMNEAALGKFTFRVARTVNKEQIRKEVEKRFKVGVLGVFTNIVKGKRRRQGTRRIEAVGASWKKAIVRLKPGQKIEAFDVAAQKN